jgi:porin
VRIGKINTVDLIAGNLFFGGWGILRFQNIAFVAPPNGLLPPVIMGGIFSYRTEPLMWTLMVYDSNNRTRDYLPDDLFDDGFNTSLGVAWGGKWAGRTTTAAVTGIYSTKDDVDLGEVLLPEDLRTSTKKDSWHLGLQFSHLLVEPEPGTGWGLFARVGFSDGNPNPYQSWITGGIGGKGLFPSRLQDRWGIGYFYYGVSDDLRNALGALVDFDDEQGAEIFYSYAVTPWFHVTGDVQAVSPAAGANETAVVGGLRARVIF